MSRRSRAQPRRRGCSCLNVLMTLLATGMILLAGFMLFGRPWISTQVSQQLIGSGPAVQTQIEGQIGQRLPAVIAALPPGEVMVTEAQINSFIAANPVDLAPLESATLHFAPGRVEADVQAFGTSSRVGADLAAQDGQLVVNNPQINGPLGLALSADSLAASLQRQINDQLAAQGQVVRDIRIEQGQIVLITE